MTQVTRAKFNLKLVINNDDNSQTTFECVSHNSSFAIDKIPLASVTLAVGRNVHTLEPAKIHSQFPAIQKMKEAQVVLVPSGKWSSARALPNDDDPNNGLWSRAGQQTIFDGYITGVGYKKVRGRLFLTVQLIHWLSDMAFSSIFSNQSHPSNPNDLIHRAVFRGGTAGQNGFIGGHASSNHFKVSAIRNDFWSESLANALCQISQRDLIQLGSPTKCLGFGNTPAKNDFALKALARFEGTHDCGERKDKASGGGNHVKLGMRGLGTVSGHVANAIRTAFSQQHMNAWWSRTLWDKLVHEIGPAFLFHIIPRVDTAIVAPFVPGLRDTWQKNVIAQDISTLNVTSYLRRPIRGVGIFANRQARTSSTDRSTTNIPRLMGVGGCFMPDPDEPGMIILQNAPNWLVNVPRFPSRPSKTVMGRAAPGGAVNITATATTPVAGGGNDPNQAAATVIASQNIYDNLAQYTYMMEVLRGRGGTVGTNFRLDIAPGSTVFIQNVGEQIINAIAQLNPNARVDLASPDVYASVLAVHLGLDAESGRAGTLLQIAHARTRTENDDTSGKTSIGAHPLYPDNNYLGAPLVNEYLFP